MSQADIRQQQLLDKLLREKYEPIAIVGMGFRFPGGNDTPAGFAEFLREGRSGTGPIPPDRWDVAGLAASDDAEASIRGRIRTQGGGFLDGIDQFDARFFNIAPKEANYIDPHHRLLLECAWRALEHANIDPHSLKDGDGGVYIGIACVDYTIEVEALRYDELDGHIGTGTSHSSAAGRLSYFLGLRGPCIAMDTACSSSLVSTHLAMQGLRRGECGIALAGGVNVVHHPRHHIIFSQANMLARDGRCKTFDERADGYGRSEGAGIVVLKRLSDALRDGNEIMALLRGSAIAQDGASAGLTVPSGPAQEMVMRRALTSAMLKAGDVNVVEAHGTGTPLGDPIEMSAVQAVFGAGRAATDPVIVGSVKTNLGHMEAAAGVGGIIKAALQLQHGEVYPHLNFETPSPQIPWARMSVQVPTTRREWPAGPRRVMVNSFGFSGIIAAILLEQAPQRPSLAGTDNGPALFVLSARSKAALRGLVQQHLLRLAGGQATESLADLCRATQVGRAHFVHRVAKAVRTREDLVAFLERSARELDAEAAAPASSPAESPGRQAPRVAFLFSGQGSQSVGMGQGLYRRFPAFREALDACDTGLQPLLNRSIRAVMFGDEPQAEALLKQTAFTQPALFALEYATAQLWRSFGVEPEALIGHSIGELVAATLAGVFELPDALRVVAERARLMQSVQAPGGMLAVSAAAQQVGPLLQGLDDVSFAALNAPSQCVISGGSASLAVIAKALAAEGIAAKALVVSHAFHSPLMKEVFPAFAQAFDGIVLHEPRITLVSNVSGAIASADEVREAAYWVRHIGAPVRFAAGMQALAARGRHLFIEVGPAPVLIGLGRASVDAKAHAWAASMHAGDADEGRLLDALAQAYLAGLAVDWAGVQRGRTGARLDLPTHPFDRKRHWLPVAHRHQRPAQASATATHPLLGVRSTDGSSNTGNGGIEFSQRLNAQSPAYLADHVVMGQVIFPAAGYVELLLALQDAVFGETSHEIVDLRIHEALSLRDDRFTVLRTVATPGDDGELEVSVFSRVEGIEGVADRHHVSALLRATPGTSGHDAAQWLASLALRGEADRTQPADALYAAYQAIGLLYGPSFRSVQRVQSWKGELAVGWIDGASAGPELMPPALLDAALQTVAGLLDSDATYLPVCLRSVLLHKKPRGALRSVVRWSEGRPGIDDELTADLLLLEGERAVLSLRGLTLRRAASAAPAPRRLVHDLRWLKRSLVQPVGAASRRVLTMGATLPAELQPSERVACVPADNLESLRDQLTRDPSVADVAWFWPSTPTPHAPQSPQTSPAELDDLRTACEHAYTSLLGLVQLLQRHFFDRKLKLWLVTRGAHADLAASTLWGFGAVLQNESPRWRTTLIDVPATSPAEGWRALIEEWSAGEAGGAENRITWRNGHRHVQRIMPPRVRSDANFRIAIREYGMLSNLMLEPAADAAPGADEIQVEMLTAGINFKDVLNVLGMLRQHALASGQAHVPLPLGFEGAGRVCAAGAQSGFAIGDEVIVNHAGCMQRRITVPALAAVRKPATLDVVQAAGIATAYVTAHYALHALAGMKAGDVVLIHAAAGGVGQAAVQLARRVGARVLATASPRKWALLRSQGVAHVMNSRTLDFAQEIQRITSGRGVDIVLNSLNKDYIPASLGVLATGGRFVELGKVGVWTPSQMRAERPDVAYHNFDLSEFEPATLLRLNRDILDEVGAQIDTGQLAPIACTEYTLDDMEEAFSVLSRGANVGKLVLRLQPDAAIAPPALAIDGESAYLITGGFGALGEHTARSLARGGARHLMLVGRKLPTDDALAALRAGLGNEVMLTAQAADVAQPADVQRLRAALVAGGRPLGGIVHAAGSLADAPIALLDWPAIDAVFKPKVYGGWLLHRMAQSLPGRPFLITYSSVAAVVGSAGQANYAAANAFLDALAGWRAAQGLPSLSIDWGPFADVGMAARLDAAQARSVEERGFRFLKPADGLCTLAELMAAPVSHAAARIVADVDWSRVAHHQSASAPLYALVASAEAAGHAPAGLDIATLMALDRDERARQVNALIRSRIAEMLQFDSADDIAPDTPFVELGLDSLVGLELMNSLEAALGVPLPNSAVFDSPTLPLMTEFILDQLDRQASPRAEEAPLAT